MSLNAAIKQVCDRLHINESIVRRRSADLLVLCYHGVIAERRPDRWSYDNWVDGPSFRAQLQWLARCLEPTDLTGLRRWLDGSWTNRKSPLLVTFDDGYRNNLTEAAPILKQEGVPALVFISTGYIGTNRTLWPDEVRMRVLHWPEGDIRLPQGETVSVLSSEQERRSLADRVTQSCKRLREAAHAAYLVYLRSKTSAVDPMDDTEARAFLSWDEARGLHGMGFEIGAHTVGHPILSRLDRGRIAQELRESKQTIERELKAACLSMAYPNGTVQDFNEDVLAELSVAGYKYAFTTAPLWQKPVGDPYRIARICVPGHTDMETFKFYVSGLHTRLTGAA
jgi:peptidoglycan/xylan/chitin deacetylase (PgdA/CDA1 family)